MRATLVGFACAGLAGCHWPWAKLAPLGATTDGDADADASDASDADASEPPIDAPAATPPCDMPDGGIPTVDAGCAVPNQLCSYTNSIDLLCRPRRLCADGRWSNASVCVSGVRHCTATAADASCAIVDAVCAGPSSLCRCTTPAPIAGDAGEPVWRCQPPPALGCPNYLDLSLNLGAFCLSEGMVCDYGSQIADLVVVCQHGVWTVGTDAGVSRD